ncbi:MAG: hypothetical protein Q6K35_00600, partial [Thermostichus sp. DG02_4_bins_136]
MAVAETLKVKVFPLVPSALAVPDMVPVNVIVCSIGSVTAPETVFVKTADAVPAIAKVWVAVTLKRCVAVTIPVVVTEAVPVVTKNTGA